jgi:myo-inositol-hexaphosphate 3-phosphohydrolase
MFTSGGHGGRSARSALTLSFLLVTAGLSVVVVTPTEAADAGRVSATVETAPMHNGGDAADDAAIWVDPDDPSRSTIIGTDKSDVGGGLVVYDLTGRELYSYPDGRMNNVDVRYNFPLAGKKVALVGVTNRVRSLDFYEVNVADRSLSKVGSFEPGAAITTPRGFALYHSPVTGKFFAFVSDSGKTEQWELDGSSGTVKGELVRRWTLGDPLHSEGLVADDEMHRVYLAQEDIGGIWRYDAEPGAKVDDPVVGTKVVSTTEENGEIGQDIKGITIYYGSGGRGYLLAASQGTNTFHAYTRDDNRPLGAFEIVTGNGVDAVTGTDGIDVTNFGVGGPFPQGFFVTQDTKNDVGNQNFKLVPWQTIASAYLQQLLVDPAYDAYDTGATPTTPSTPPAPPTGPSTPPAPPGHPASPPSPPAPVTTGPVTHLTSPGGTTVSVLRFPVSWTVSGSSPGVARTEVQRRTATWRGGFGAWTTWATSQGGTSVTHTGRPARTYCFRARSTDVGGRVGAWSPEQCRTTPVDDRTARVGPGWRRTKVSGSYLGSETVTARHGARLVLAGGQGTRYALLATTCRTCGSVDVSIGGRVVRRVSLASTHPSAHRVLPVASYRRVHTGPVTVTVTSRDKPVRIDGVAIGR